MSGDIFLTIDTIVLHGLEHVDRHGFEVALEESIRQYLTANHCFHPADASRLQLQITLPAVLTAESLGSALGDRLAGSIGGSGESRDFGKHNSAKGDGK
ncbi:hypothetical protein [Desulfopila aestuarii]|uniref:Uncharacterized protein n=1 Tax=Desulfopila aestuarii DSM 18488 TaxID=1121416 RepID=A0A1M7XYN7_9BACT|nr:hypothetical protein [Desulfopila aestuarii]SHO44174.1 hypothetical protein SAMN02745220_00683 [Desulfopila aestuarii DSM 18488]